MLDLESALIVARTLTPRKGETQEMTPQDASSVISRRDIVRLTAAILVGGIVGTRSTSAFGAFPDPLDWTVGTPGNNELDKLGKLIVFDKNPYCTQISQNCQAGQPQTFPRRLEHMRVLTSSDFRQEPLDWKSTETKIVEKAFRIPYLYKESPTKTDGALVLDYLLIGFGNAGTTPKNTTGSWGSPSAGSSLGNLGRFMTNYLKPDTTAPIVRVNGWDGMVDTGATPTSWAFRGVKLKVEWVYRLPAAVDGPGPDVPLIHYYFGYEGGGAL